LCGSGGYKIDAKDNSYPIPIIFMLSVGIPRVGQLNEETNNEDPS